MALVSLAARLGTVLTVASVASTDATGKPTLGPKRTIRARVEARRQLVRNAQGEDAVATHRIFTLDPVALTDRVWLPGYPTTEDGARTPLAVKADPDFDGTRVLYEVQL